MAEDSLELLEKLRRAQDGDPETLGRLLDDYRARLRRMIDLRMDLRLRGRIDASDVVQDAFLEAARRLEEYLKNPTMPFFLWLRFITGQRLMALQRQHLGAKARDVRREVPLRAERPAADATSLAMEITARQTSPTRAAARKETRIRLEEALNSMDPIDREVLVLRHFEQLSNVEAAAELNIQTSAASKRYFRALARLREILKDIPGLAEPAR